MHLGLRIARKNLCSALTFVVALTCQGVAIAQPPALSTAHAVHELPPDVAANHLPVHLLATVTYYEPGESTLFVADATGAVYVKTTHPYPIHRGDLVRVDGVTAKSFRTTVAANPSIHVVGKGTIQHARITSLESYKDFMSGKWDCQYVTLRGVVRAAVFEDHNDSQVAELEILMPGGLVQAYVQDNRGLPLSKLMDATVEISGVVAGDFNAQWQLMRSVIYAASAEDLTIVQQPRLGPLSIPISDIDHLIQTRSIVDRSRRVRVRGTVTFYRPGNSIVVMQNDGRSLFAATRQGDPIPLGSVVDLVGFADDSGYAPTLGQTEIFPTGKILALRPTPVTYTQAIGGTHSDDLVSLQGHVISQLHTEASDTLVLMVENHAVTVVLNASKARQGVPKLPLGALVTATGICRITPTGEWGTPGTTPMLFRLDMRSPGDLQLIALPTWWNVTHLLSVACGLLALFVVTTAWALGLRRRVANQSASIHKNMYMERERSRLLEAINSEMPLTELLKSICAAVDILGPGLSCCCSIVNHGTERNAPPTSTCIGDPPTPLIAEALLTDTHGKKIGSFSIGYARGIVPPRQEALSKYEREVFTMGTGLLNLAVNQRRMYQELNYTSTHDQLTSLPNRRLSDSRLEQALEEAAHTGKRVAVAYIDVDEFKKINDRHGHKTGDLYLQQIAARLTAGVRAEDKLARIGGDEFLLIATALANVADAEAYKRRLEGCFQEPFHLDGISIQGAASVGIAVFPEHGANAEDLKRHADFEMYSAKHHRRARKELRSPESLETEVFSPANLEVALETNRFRLFYQPQFSPNGTLRGLEALLRLQDPILGLVTPDAFIGVAERNDVILPLGAWVIRQALSDAMAWQFDTMEDVLMVVNVSARQIESPTFAEEVALALEHAGLPPSSLELEITERTFARDLEQALRQVKRLHDTGVRISIDDFGTEHSTLSALHRLPIDTLKIDRSFVRAMQSEPNVMHIVEAIVTMGLAMQKRIVAEGVEFESEWNILKKLGQMDFQGFFFGRPQPAESIALNLPTWCRGLVVADSHKTITTPDAA